MYAICNIVYGSPWTDEVEAVYRDQLKIDTADWRDFDRLVQETEKAGWEHLYSGGEGSPGFIGVELSETDECRDYQLLRELTFVPTSDQMEEVKEKIAALHPDVKAVLLPCDTYLIWSDS